MINRKLVAIEPKRFEAYELAVIESGAELSELNTEVGALVWTDYSQPEALAKVLSENPQIEWVQLPFAGVDAFERVLQLPFHFTSAKGSYKEPVAEHALMLAMALGRKLPERVRATTWGKKFAVSLYDATVVIVGAGGIAEELIKLLKPFRANVVAVRNQPKEMPGASKTVSLEQLDQVLPEAQFVILACALTSKTRGLFNAALLSKMKPDAYLVNVARGEVIVTADLVAALNSDVIAGAAVDVTDPEPLPDGNALWSAKNVIITPHTADTMQIVTRLFSIRLRENVRAYLGQGPWVGTVSKELGY